MERFDNILYPVDLSESSPRIVPYVKTVAAKFEATIHLLFVARIFDYFSGIYVPAASICAMEQEIVKGAERSLDEFADTHFGTYEPGYTASVLSGDAAEMIMDYILSHVIDLVIMGTHGRKGLDKIIMGSVAERIVRSSPVPVMVVNPYKVAQ
ncbi:MAG: universal stress protein [Deltaproteobacteria bacterium]|nr:universal stress protein [Deltaproteobacteria bacterium]